MNGREALMLVRKKYLEEEKGITSGKKADEYKRACEQYPALMTTAHYLWAHELTKNREMRAGTLVQRENEPLPGLKPGVSGLSHAWHDLRPCQTMPGKASASLRKDAIHPQA